MTHHVAYIAVTSNGFDSEEVTGEGATEEEAVENCLAQVRRHLIHRVRLAEGIMLPEDVAARVPTVPDGHGLLILERCSHSDGRSYDWRFFAVRRGQRVLGYLEAGASPVRHVFADSNSEYEYRLPKGSMEFVDGRWVPRTVAQYSY